MNDINLKNLTDKDYIIIGKMWEMKSALSEYRIIAALKLKRPLERGEIVHHLNGNHEDNRPENLRVCSSINEHWNYHLDKIGKIRNKLRIKQEELAKALGITVTDLSYIENKSFYPTSELAEQISQLLNVPVGALWNEYELELIRQKYLSSNANEYKTK